MTFRRASAESSSVPMSNSTSPFTWSRESPRQFESTPGEETRTWRHSSMNGCAESFGRRGKKARASNADLALEVRGFSVKELPDESKIPWGLIRHREVLPSPVAQCAGPMECPSHVH